MNSKEHASTVTPAPPSKHVNINNNAAPAAAPALNNQCQQSTLKSNDMQQPDDDDTSGILSQKLNGVILQYLQACGLEQSYHTFCKECQLNEVPFPNDLPAQPYFTQQRRTVNQKDAQELVKCFEEENGDKLINLWNSFASELNNGHDQESQTQASHEPIAIGMLTFFVHVLAAIIPYRQNRSQEEKLSSMTKLQQFFQDKSQDQTASTDSNMLSLYALPFVPDPMNHANFKTIFEDSWKARLKAQVETVLSNHFETSEIIPGANSELYQIFINYFQQQQCDTTAAAADENDNSIRDCDREPISSSSSPKLALVSTSTSTSDAILSGSVNADLQKPALESIDVGIQTEETTSNLKQTQMNEALQVAYSHNHRLNLEIQEVKVKLFQTEDKYYKLIQSTAEVVSSLELAVQGKFQSIDALSEKLLRVFPELFAQEKVQNAIKSSHHSYQLYIEDEQLTTQASSCDEEHQQFRPPAEKKSLSSVQCQTIYEQDTSAGNVNGKNLTRPKVPSKHVLIQKDQNQNEVMTYNYDVEVDCNVPLFVNSQSFGAHKLREPGANLSSEKKGVTGQKPTTKLQPYPTHGGQQQHQSQQQSIPTSIRKSGPTLAYDNRGNRIPEGQSQSKVSPSPRSSVTLAVFPTATHQHQTSAAPVAYTNPQKQTPFYASTQGRPTVSMCPTNLRAQFQPIHAKGSEHPSPAKFPNLRTQTRTIYPPNLNPNPNRVEVEVLDRQDGRAAKAKRYFRRVGVGPVPGAGAGVRREDETHETQQDDESGPPGQNHEPSLVLAGPEISSGRRAVTFVTSNSNPADIVSSEKKYYAPFKQKLAPGKSSLRAVQGTTQIRTAEKLMIQEKDFENAFK